MRFIQVLCFYVLLSGMLILGTRNVSAQSNYSFEHYNTNNGLSQNTVRAIFQDSQGFMWFGTKDGLNRFDGKSFKVFRSSFSSDLNDNVFHRILEDENGDIWVATEDGVYIFNPFQEKFTRFCKKNDSVDGVVTEMVMDHDGDVWMSVENKGIYHYSMKDDNLSFYQIPLVKDGMKMVSLCSDNDKGVWVFPYSSPFFRINKHTGEISRFVLSDDEELFNNVGEVHSVLDNQPNNLLVATSEKGVISINTINRTHRVLLDKDAKGEPVFARCLRKIDQNKLWVGSESGIFVYDMESGEVIQTIRYNSAIPSSLSDNAVYSIYQDREGGIWVGSYFGGVDYIPNRGDHFELFYPIEHSNSIKGRRVREFCSTSDNHIWIGTEDGGLNLFDPQSSRFLPLPAALHSLYTNVHGLLNDGDYLWIGSFSKGLLRYNLKSGELRTYKHSDAPNSLGQNSPFALCKDSQGHIWVGTLTGVDIYDYETDRFTQLDELKGFSIMDIYEDSRGFVWVCTFLDGLYRFDPATNEWEIFRHHIGDKSSLPYNKVTGVYEDSNKHLWVTTQGGGFSLFDRASETFSTFNSFDGLPNEVVYQIVEDDDHNLWLSTNSGLVLFDIDNNTFRSYNVSNGLKTNQFNYQSSYKAPNGDIYFGSLDGFVRFNPATFKDQSTNVSLVFTDLNINNVKISPADEKSPLSQSILYTEGLKLKHHQNSLMLHYAVLNYSGLYDDRVYYKMVGVDDKWNQSSDQQSIVYSNLKPGEYELLLGFSGEDNDTINTAKSLSIQIHPPIWQNGWAYFVYLLLLLAMIMIVLRFLSQRTRHREQERMRDFEQQKERELYRSKIDFFTNVAHEIRTPLSLIKAPLSHIIKTGKVSTEVEEHLLIISKNTDRLHSLTNQLLDFRKTESDAYVLNLFTINVSELIRDTFLRFTPLANQRGLQFELDLPETDIFIKADKEAVLKVMSNLLNNALKFSESYVRMEVFTVADDEQDQFHLLVINDGEKIPTDQKDNIFNPFVQLQRESDRKGVGTGIGLALSKSLTELHKGELLLDVDSDEYVQFHLILPMGEVEKSSPESKSLKIENDSRKNQEQILSSTAKATILLVDDDIELLQFEQKFLSPHYHVLTAADGIEALNILQETTINLIVSDVMMPKMDGLQFTERVKSDIEFSHIPVILLTAKVNVESKVQGFEVGADAYIEKPFTLEVLIAQIANLIESREKLREKFLQNPFMGAGSIVHSKSDEEFLKKLHGIVHENIDNAEFIVEDIAEEFNMSRASLYRKIKGFLNLTPNEYIRVERLKMAAQLLREKNHKVNEICYMVGFNSPSYFSKCFQQKFGVLPKDFE